jgi:SAM-dependent methyltransferase
VTTPSHSPWHPASDSLEFDGGLWKARSASDVDYPDDGNDLCLQVESSSFWFTHRLDCILEGLRHFQPVGPFLDVGGGNGFVALALQQSGIDVMLLEPGPGARNALARGVRQVIQGTLEDAQLHAASIGAAGAFDVLEHIPDDATFLRLLQSKLRAGGRFYGTVPAYPALWSESDVQAGHARRYTAAGLRQTLSSAGFKVEFMTGFFAWLVLPVYFFRALPWKLSPDRKASPITGTQLQFDHHLPRWLGGTVRAAHMWECARLRRRKPLCFGTSLFFIARA